MLVVMVGLPGSGKSTYARSCFRNIVSPDEIRLERFGRRFAREYEAAVWRIAYHEVAERLAIGQVVCFDATSVTERRRRKLISLAHDAGRPAVAIWMDTPLALAWERNDGRPERVPRAAFFQLARAFQPPAVEEGFAAVSIIRTREEVA